MYAFYYPNGNHSPYPLLRDEFEELKTDTLTLFPNEFVIYIAG